MRILFVAALLCASCAPQSGLREPAPAVSVPIPPRSPAVHDISMPPEPNRPAISIKDKLERLQEELDWVDNRLPRSSK